MAARLRNALQFHSSCISTAILAQHTVNSKLFLNNKIPHVCTMATSSSSISNHGSTPCNYDYLLILDFEATCDRERTIGNKYPQVNRSLLYAWPK